ncbi:ABC transporter substrate-binding protein [Streptomyces sp. NPDC049881]|uniref:ABC transporter substrate-binding protein n=1 Tax=Streptomyces sp. NPDC049881 TaxID=3155778 RepID=UPI00341DC381
MTSISRRDALRAGLTFAGLIATGSALAACGSDEAGDGGESEGGGTLRWGGVGAANAVTTDPHGGIPSESDWARFCALYDVLTMPGPDGAVLPWLATEWSADQGATRHRFTLREDAVFSDGTPVRAADVLHSLRRIADKAAENGGRIGTVDVAKSRAEGDHVLVLETSAPEADLARALAGQCFVVPDGTAEFERPVGSGPFTLTTQEGATAVLTRNDRWWGEGPKLERLEIRAFADPQALSSAVRSGEIDVAVNVDYATAQTAERDPARLTVVRRPRSSSYPLVMHLDHAPFDDPRVRRAVKAAVDRPALVRAVLMGYGTPSNDAPFFADPSYPGDLPAPARDLTAARDLLAEAGHAEGFDTVIHATTAYPAMLKTATLLAQQLAEVGIRAEVEEHTPEIYWSQIYTQVPLYIGYTTDALPIQHWARATTLSTAPGNETGWRSQEFDDAFLAAMATGDADSRRQQLTGLQTQLAEEGGWVMWGVADGVDLAAAAVQDLPEVSGFARYSLADTWLRN